MNGTIQLRNGIWYCKIYYIDESGKNKQKWISTGLGERGNKKAAKEILDKEIESFQKQRELGLEKLKKRKAPKEEDRSQIVMLFGDYCMQHVESLKNILSPIVYDNYKHHYGKHIKIYFDERKMRLIDIGTEDIMDFYSSLKKKGLSNTSLKHYENIIRPSLRTAYKNKLIPDNPYDFVPTIKREKPPIAYYDESELGKLFQTVRGSKLELIIKMAAFYGLRRSEILGIKWSAIDFDHKTLAINHKILVVKRKVILSDIMKTETSSRMLPLIDVIADELKYRKKWIESNKAFYGNKYNNEYSNYVFVDETGKLIYPNVVTATFIKIMKQHNLKHIRFHDLRHSCASVMLANKVQMKQIQEWLGHSNFATTANVYSHLDFSSKIESAQTIATALTKNYNPYPTYQDIDNYEDEEEPPTRKSDFEM